MAWRGNEVLGVQELGGLGEEAQALQTGGCEDKGVVVGTVQLGQTGGDVAANGDNFEVWADGFHETLPARTSRANPRSRGQSGKTSPGCADQGVPRVSAGANGGNAEAFRQFGGEILEAVDGHIHLPRQERLFQLLDEHANAERGKRSGGVPVAGGGDDAGVESDVGLKGLQGSYDFLNLAKGQLAAASANPNGPGSHG